MNVELERLRPGVRLPGGGDLARGALRRLIHGWEQVTDSLPAARGTAHPARTIVILASLLALEAADSSTIGAAAPQVQGALKISHAELGLLVSVSLLVGSATTLPMGVLVDRLCRKRLLVAAVVAWNLVIAACGAAQSFEMLVLTRVALGAVTAVAWPAVASLTGDFFPATDRGRIYGYIVCGELVGAGVGFLASGNVTAALSWRAAFWVLVLPGAALAVAVAKLLPEPPRVSGPSRPRSSRARGMSLAQAVRYLLGIRTNVIIIAASSLASFFLVGEQTFGIEFMRGRYSLSQSAATMVLTLVSGGTIVGVLLGGRVADRLLRGGRVSARVVVPGVAYIAAGALAGAGVISSSLLIAAPLFFLGAVAIQAGDPGLDAARLDIVPGLLWGRAEGVRNLLRSGVRAVAPVLFGVLADVIGGHSTNPDAGGSQVGLAAAFLVALGGLVLSGMVLLRARRTYPRDAARARAARVG